MKPTRSATGRIALTCILISTGACVAEFPATTSVFPISIDAGPQSEAGATDALPPDLDGAVPPSDGGPPVDQGILDMAPDVFVDPNACRLAPVRELTLRTWKAEGATRVLELNTDCETIELDPPAWLRVTLEGQRLRIEAPAARGVSDGVIALTADGRTVNIAVRRIGLEEGGGRRRALIYVVDGLKGETIEQSAPEAIDWLAKFATTAYDAVPHTPPENATRASGWGSLLTGLARVAHGFDGAGAIGVPTFTDRLGGKVFAAVEWDVAAAGLSVAPLSRRDVISRTISAFDSEASLFVVGVNGLLGAELDELGPRRAQIDADLDALLAGIADRPADEDWLIVLTAATSGGQGPPDLPVLYAAPGLIVRDPGDVTLMDVHTSVLAWLNALRPGWDLPGEQLTGGVEVDCGDGADNDGDGRTDCRDADCEADCDLDCIDIELSTRLGSRVVDVSLADFDDDLMSCANMDMQEDELSADVTARWIAPRAGQYIISTLDSVANESWDPVLDTRIGECVRPPGLICRDDAFESGSPAILKLDAVEGGAYLFSISSFDAPSIEPEARLSIVETRAACALAPEIDGIGELRLANNDREMSLPIPTNPPQPADPLANECRQTVAQRMVRWRAEAGDWMIDVDVDVPFPYSLSLWGGECEALSFIDCTLVSGRVVLEEAGDYLIVVSSVWSSDGYATGAFSVAVRPWN
ncbi:MAG: hypothetical protein ACI9U2_000930 [Bradymonadia bacterium]